MAEPQKWLCTECRFTLGFVEEKTTVRIKRKDLYVEVKGGTVKVTCCRCGKQNILEDVPVVKSGEGKEVPINGL